jgi:hypothetical protein
MVVRRPGLCAPDGLLDSRRFVPYGSFDQRA